MSLSGNPPPPSNRRAVYLKFLQGMDSCKHSPAKAYVLGQASDSASVAAVSDPVISGGSIGMGRLFFHLVSYFCFVFSDGFSGNLSLLDIFSFLPGDLSTCRYWTVSRGDQSRKLELFPFFPTTYRGTLMVRVMGPDCFSAIQSQEQESGTRRIPAESLKHQNLRSVREKGMSNGMTKSIPIWFPIRGDRLIPSFPEHQIIGVLGFLLWET